jgi:hypothetical protein
MEGKMKIQIVGRYSRDLKNTNKYDIYQTLYSDPLSPDMFDINILDLSSALFDQFSNHSNGKYHFMDNGDILSFIDMLNNSKKTKKLVVLPDNQYLSNHRLKDFIKSTELYVFPCQLVRYETNMTTIEEIIYKSDFYLLNNEGTMLKSNSSDKNVLIEYNNSLITTLNIFETNKHLDVFINKIFIKEEAFPIWLDKYIFYDDEELKSKLKSNKSKIDSIALENIKLENIILTHNKIKAILIETGPVLVEKVIEILKEIFPEAKHPFKDKLKEDFRIDFEDAVFAIEVKGVNTNVNNPMISQTEGHATNIAEEATGKKVKPLLIVNHQRKSEIEKRQPINQEQIKKAEKLEVCIVEAITLLKIYEQYLKKDITSELIYKLFMSTNGIVQLK